MSWALVGYKIVWLSSVTDVTVEKADVIAALALLATNAKIAEYEEPANVVIVQNLKTGDPTGVVAVYFSEQTTCNRFAALGGPHNLGENIGKAVYFSLAAPRGASYDKNDRHESRSPPSNKSLSPSSKPASPTAATAAKPVPKFPQNRWAAPPTIVREESVPVGPVAMSVGAAVPNNTPARMAALEDLGKAHGEHVDLIGARVRVIERALEELKGAQHRSDQKMDLILEAIKDQTERGGGKRQRESAPVTASNSKTDTLFGRVFIRQGS